MSDASEKPPMTFAQFLQSQHRIRDDAAADDSAPSQIWEELAADPGRMASTLVEIDRKLSEVGINELASHAAEQRAAQDAKIAEQQAAQNARITEQRAAQDAKIAALGQVVVDLLGVIAT